MASSAMAEAPTSEDDWIPYRQLSRTDFLGSMPPPDLVHHSDGLEAASCLRIMWPDDLPIEITPQDRRRVGIVKAIVVVPRFHAVFERSCSWWGQPEDEAYALEHEQVHFAVAEHAARELMRKVSSTDDRPRARGSTREEAIAELRDLMRALASQAMLDTRSVHAAYDAATRDDPSLVAHREWMRRYDALLAREP